VGDCPKSGTNRVLLPQPQPPGRNRICHFNRYIAHDNQRAARFIADCKTRGKKREKDSQDLNNPALTRGRKESIGVWMPRCRILVVEDFELFRRVICSILRRRSEFQIIAEASDGLEAVHLAEKLQPDLILLDVGLPRLNGLEATKLIRERAPNARILFVSQERSSDVVRECLRSGGLGYVQKMRTESDLLPAIDAALQGKEFVSSLLRRDTVPDITGAKTPRCHEALFYSDNRKLLDRFARIIAVALNAGDAAIVVATESHRHDLVQRLKAQGVDADIGTQQGTYIALDVTEALSLFMVNDMPDPARFFEVAGGLLGAASTATKRDRSHVVVCAECALVLWTEGKADAAIRVEQLWNEVTAAYEVNTLCGYPLTSFDKVEDEQVFGRICDEHSAVVTATENN
jgi:DNA-binding NarL/FixJ family response regulator